MRIAVAGLACRFPDAENERDYWGLIERGETAIREVPTERWDAAVLYDENASVPGRTVSKWGGFIQGADTFDAEFFGMSSQEAERVDPQQRVILELVWHALENAGLRPSELQQTKTGVFMGASHSDYERVIYRELSGIQGFDGPGVYHALIANRVSYSLGLHGPSLVVDSACSSSLSALHVAAQSLSSGESEIAIVGGVNLNFTPEETVGLTKAGLLSPTGACRPFDAKADGFVRGEGAGVVILVSEALAHRLGLRARAWLLGTAVNQDGASNGLMAPNGRAQVALLKAAMEASQLAPSAISMMETHSTGTPLGDSIEFRALSEALDAPADQTCFIGCAKGNIGHLESASGIAGVIKAILSLERRMVPVLRNFEAANEFLQTDGKRFCFPQRTMPWEVHPGAVRRVGVSAFGFGGANAHAILEEVEIEAIAPDEDPKHEVWLPVSARSQQALQVLGSELAEAVEEPTLALADLALTLGSHRDHLKFRRVVRGRSRQELAQQLRSMEQGKEIPRGRRRVLFWFSGGQGNWERWRRIADDLGRFGISPDGVGGHGSGVFAALASGGALTWDEARACADQGELLGELHWPQRLGWLSSGEGLRLRNPGRKAILEAAGKPDELVSLPAQGAHLIVALGPAQIKRDGCWALPEFETFDAELLDLVADLHCAGIAVDWAQVNRTAGARLARLPGYPFQRKRHWVRDVGSPDEGTLRAAADGLWGPRSSARTEKAADHPTSVGELCEWLRTYSRRKIAHSLNDERRSLQPSVVLDFGNRGLLGLQAERRFGGLGLTDGDTLKVFEQLGAIDLTLASFVGVHNVLGIRPLAAHGRPEHKEEWLPRLAAGRQLAGFALTELSAGSNPRALRSRVVTSALGMRLNGQKEWVGNAGWAGLINVFAQEFDPASRLLGVSGFAVPTDEFGLEVGDEALTMGVRGMVQNRVVFDDVQVHESQRLGNSGDGFAAAQTAMFFGRLGLAAVSLGALERCALIFAGYCAERSIATGRHLDNAVTVGRLSRMVASIDCLRALVQRMGEALDSGVHLPEEAYLIAKIAGPELLWQGLDATMQALGARGYLEPSGLPQLFRDARLLRIFEGPTEALQVALGSSALKSPQTMHGLLESTLGGNEAADELLEQLNDWNGGNSALSPFEQQRLFYSVGCVTTWASLRAASIGAGSPASSLAWVEERWRSRARGVVARKNSYDLSPRELLNIVERFEERLGPAHYNSGGENQQSMLPVREENVNRADVSPEPDNGRDVSRGTQRSVEGGERSKQGFEGSSVEEWEEWLLQSVAQSLGVPAEQIDRGASFANLGLDSLAAVRFAEVITSRLGRRVDATVLWSFSTIEELGAYLARICAPRESFTAELRPTEESRFDVEELAALVKELEREVAE